MTRFAFRMVLDLAPSSKWKLLPKFQSVLRSQREANLIGRCRLEPDTPYLIDKIERFGLCGLYVVHLVCPPLDIRLYWLPEHYAVVVTDEDIKTADSGHILHVLVLRNRKDMPGIFDLVVV